MTTRFLKRSLSLMAFLLLLAGFIPRDVVRSQSAQEEKPVEQVKKNIQALKGMPDSELRPLMNYFNAALGVRCNFCHVMKDGKIDFVSDEHEHKGIARQMIKMVQDINKGNFAGKTEVSCYTCHQGKPVPAAAPAFPLPAPMGPRPPGPGGPATPPPPPAAAAAPNAEQIWDKYAQAAGGKETIARFSTRALKGTFQNGNNQTMNAEVKFAAPGKLLTTMTLEQGGEIVSGFDGVSGYLRDPRGVRPLNSAEIRDIRLLAEAFSAIKLSEPYPKMSAGRRTKINERDAAVLRFTQGNTRTTLFFDAETGLLLRRIDLRETFLGAVPQQYDFEDYREVDGLRLPMTIRVFSVDNASTGIWKFTEVKHNVALDGVKFSQ